MSYQRAIFLTLFLLVGSTVAAAQQSDKTCITDTNAPPQNTWHWPAGTHVKVYLKRGMFNRNEQKAIREVMEQWNVVSELAGTGIRYEYAGEVDQPKDGLGDLTLTRIEIMKGTNNRYFAYFFPVHAGKGLIRSAQITFDFLIKDIEALRSFVAHELGHGMGLRDCKSCKRKSTIMNGYPGVNKGNGLVAPSACDARVVKAIFEEERRLAGVR